MDNDTAQSLHGIAVYNPDLLSKSELIDQFVARRPLLARLVEDLRPLRPQHKLLVGTRGMGKTTLLRRLRFAIEDDPELNGRLIPLIFPEEQYNVTRLSDLYINCIDALGDLLEERGRRAEATKLDEFTAALVSADDRTVADRARDFLVSEAARLDRGLVLLIDNADLIFDGLPEDEEWAFRELLSHESQLVFIGATIRPIEAEFTYNRPFHDFFQVHELRGFGQDETSSVLRTLAQLGQTPQVELWLDHNPSRLQTINILSGGNPRAVVLLYQLLAQGTEGTVRSDLERLLDLYTPHYKARFEDLPKQAQLVLDALALHWDPATAADLATSLRMDVNTVSSQLNRLVKHGIVEQVSYYPGPRSGFQIAERFFNIWYLMRASRRIRRRLQWLVEFLRLFYSQEDLKLEAKRHLRLLTDHDAQSILKHVEYSFCLAQAIDGCPVRGALETSALHSLFEDRTLRRDIASYVDLDGLDNGLKTVAERIAMLDEAHENISTLEISWSDQTPEGFWALLGSSPSLSAEEKRSISAQMKGMAPDDIFALGRRLQREIDRYVATVGNSRVTDTILDALRSGYMGSSHDVDGARAVSELKDVPDVIAVALAKRLQSEPNVQTLKEIEDFLSTTTSPYPVLVAAEYGRRRGWKPEQMDQAVNRIRALAGDNPANWNSLGELLHHIGRYAEAVQAHQRAAELDPNNSDPWYLAAELLLCHLGRPKEAEQAYRLALSSDPENTKILRRLGELLNREGVGASEAEEIFRKMIVSDPRSADSWLGLGNVLHDRPDSAAEAEEAYRKAMELDTKSSEALVQLACLLNDNSRFGESEELAKRAVSLFPKDPIAWAQLGRSVGGVRKDQEAEDAYREAIRLNPKYPFPWGLLGDVLRNQRDRHVEAEEAYRMAISLSPQWANPWGALGDLLRQTGKETEAEEAYSRSIALNPNWSTALIAWADLIGHDPARADEALDAYRRAAQINAADVYAWRQLAQKLYESAHRDSDEAELAARKALELRPSSASTLVLALILVARRKWTDAEQYASSYLVSQAKELSEDAWTGVITFFKAAVEAGQAKNSVALLDRLELTEKWRPLREALAALAEGTPNYLRRVSPEVRQPAEKILKDLSPEAQTTNERRRPKRRSR